MFGFCHFVRIQIDSGFSHTCVLLSNHFKYDFLSGKFNTCVVFATHVWFLAHICDFYKTCAIFTHVVGVLCCAASDIEIKGQVSHFEMHFRDFSSFSSQCYISARWITSKNYRGESQKKSLTQGWKGRSHPWPLALWGEVKWRGENIHQSMDMIDMWRPTRKEHHKVKI